MATITTTQQFAEGNQVTAATLNDITNNSAFASTVVDNVTTALDSVGGVANSKIIVKDAGITPAKLNLNDSVTITDSTSFLVFNNTSEDVGFIGTDSGTGNFFINAGGSTDELVLKTNGATRATIKSDGNIGIGTTSPTATLHIVDQGNTQPCILVQGATTSEGDIAVIDGEALQIGHWSGSSFTERMVIASDGKVGIGTTSPNQKLELSEDSPTLRLTDTDTELSDGELSSNIEFYQSDASGAGVGASIASHGFGTTGKLDLRFATGDNTARMAIDGNGNVGIGELSPSNKLHVKDGDIKIVHQGGNGFFNNYDGAGTVVLRHGVTYGLVGTTSSTKFAIRTNDTDRITTLADGNVGIGETNPSNKLEVNGTLKATGNVDFDSDLNVDGNAQIDGNVQVDGTFGFNSGTSVTAIETDGTLGGNSNDVLPTEKAIKTYIDTYAAKTPSSGATGTITLTTSYKVLDLSTAIGASARAIVHMEIKDGDDNRDAFFRTNGSNIDDYNGGSDSGWGATGGVVGTSNRGFNICIVTDASGKIQYKAAATVNNATYVVRSVQRMLS